jgi:hypothetical protein
VPAFIEQVATAIGGFDLVVDRVRQRHLDHFVWKVRALALLFACGRTGPGLVCDQKCSPRQSYRAQYALMLVNFAKIFRATPVFAISMPAARALLG